MPDEPPNTDLQTDRQLLTRIAWQFVVVFLLIMFFDTLLEWLVEGLHILLELLHLVIEVFEHLIEELLEHLLHSSHHQSETIIFNSVMLLVIFGIYHLFRCWPALSLRWQQRLQAAWQGYRNRKVQAWQRLPRRQKRIVTATYASGSALILFLLTL
ncbi:MAG: hypothetical protein WCT16_05505 [Candidatus Buchananbacteria bacterium]